MQQAIELLENINERLLVICIALGVMIGILFVRTSE